VTISHNHTFIIPFSVKRWGYSIFIIFVYLCLFLPLDWWCHLMTKIAITTPLLFHFPSRDGVTLFSLSLYIYAFFLPLDWWCHLMTKIAITTPLLFHFPSQEMGLLYFHNSIIIFVKGWILGCVLKGAKKGSVEAKKSWKKVRMGRYNGCKRWG